MAKEMDRGRAAVLAIAARGAINADDVAALRREVFAEGFVSREEADALFALERACPKGCAEWTEFFVEAITDHVVWQARPTGVVNETQAEWLISRADAAASLNGLAALVNVLAEAHRTPLWLVAAARARAARGWSGVDDARAMVA